MTLLYTCILIIILFVLYWSKKRPNNYEKLHQLFINDITYDEFAKIVKPNPFIYFELRQLYALKGVKVTQGDHDLIWSKYN